MFFFLMRFAGVLSQRLHWIVTLYVNTLSFKVQLKLNYVCSLFWGEKQSESKKGTFLFHDGAVFLCIDLSEFQLISNPAQSDLCIKL